MILSGVMMFEYMKWTEAAKLIVDGLENAIASKRVTYDFHRLMEGATLLKCSEFGDEIIKIWLNNLLNINIEKPRNTLSRFL